MLLACLRSVLWALGCNYIGVFVIAAHELHHQKSVMQPTVVCNAEPRLGTGGREKFNRPDTAGSENQEPDQYAGLRVAAEAEPISRGELAAEHLQLVGVI